MTSGGYGHRIGKNITYAYIYIAHAEINTRLRVGIPGDQYDAAMVGCALYDTDNERIRGQAVRAPAGSSGKRLWRHRLTTRLAKGVALS